MKKILILIMVVTLTSCSYLHKKSEFGDFDWKNVLSDSTRQMSVDESDFVSYKVQQTSENHYGNLDDYADSVWAIPLETTAESIIGHITKMQLSDSAFFISDYQTNLIKVFDRQGHYLYNIGSVGNGPFEYVQPTDFVVFNNKVFVLDQFQHRLIVYGHDGKGLKEYRIPFYCIQIGVIDDNTFLFRGLNSDNDHIPELLDYSLWVCDTTMQVKKYGCYQKHDEYESILNNNLKQSGDKIYFNDLLNDTIFSVTKDGNLKCELVFDFQGKIDKGLFKRGTYVDNYNSGKIYELSKYFICDSMLVYYLSIGRSSHLVVSSLNSDKYKYFELNNYTQGMQNVSKLLEGFLNPLASENDCMIFANQPNDIIESYYRIGERAGLESIAEKNDKYIGLDTDLNLVDKIDEESNPVLVFCKLKKW